LPASDAASRSALPALRATAIATRSSCRSNAAPKKSPTPPLQRAREQAAASTSTSHHAALHLAHGHRLTRPITMPPSTPATTPPPRRTRPLPTCSSAPPPPRQRPLPPPHRRLHPWTVRDVAEHPLLHRAAVDGMPHDGLFDLWFT
jgi:hypothetical protein